MNYNLTSRDVHISAKIRQLGQNSLQKYLCFFNTNILYSLYMIEVSNDSKIYISFTIPRLPSRVLLGQNNLWCNLSRIYLKYVYFYRVHYAVLQFEWYNGCLKKVGNTVSRQRWDFFFHLLWTLITHCKKKINTCNLFAAQISHFNWAIKY